MSNIEITTNGQLRMLLAETISKVSAGEVDVQSAGVMAKLAAQITENQYAELKARMVLNILPEALLGSLPIGVAGKSSV